jgi:hypothetical protein
VGILSATPQTGKHIFWTAVQITYLPRFGRKNAFFPNPKLAPDTAIPGGNLTRNLLATEHPELAGVPPAYGQAFSK